MNIEEAKIECRVAFCDGKELVSDGYDAIMHRFVHTYDSKTMFWYGTFEIAASEADWKRAYPKPGADMNLHVVFPDDIGGRVHCSNIVAEAGHIRLAGSCISGLCLQKGFLRKA